MLQQQQFEDQRQLQQQDDSAARLMVCSVVAGLVAEVAARCGECSLIRQAHASEDTRLLRRGDS